MTKVLSEALCSLPETVDSVNVKFDNGIQLHLERNNDFFHVNQLMYMGKDDLYYELYSIIEWYIIFEFQQYTDDGICCELNDSFNLSSLDVFGNFTITEQEP